MKVAKKTTALVLTAVLAVGLVPAPAFAAAGEGLVASGFSALTLPVADYSWYAPGKDSYEISSNRQFMGFANLVNGTAPDDVADGAVSFAGATVKSTSSGTWNLNGEWVPVGSEEHPFAGVFDGNGVTCQGFVVSGANRGSYLGMFGYATGSVKNVKAGNGASVEVTRKASDGEVVHHVGGVAGYCKGEMSGCENGAKVIVSSDVEQKEGFKQVVFAVGGVAGECVGDMASCENEATGTVTVTATAKPAGDSADDDTGLVRYVGGVVGASGDLTQVGKTVDAPGHVVVRDCENRAQVTVETPSNAGFDRFGSTVFARGVCIGGVVGYARGDVTGCENGDPAGLKSSPSGYVRAEHGSCVGGIVGSLRATPSTSPNKVERVAADDGGVGKDPVCVSGCVNYGDVYGLDSVGGVVGSAGSHTTVRGCVNSLKSPAGITNQAQTYVVATRWNKPTPAGVVGVTVGDVEYCANFATVASGTWKDEASRTLEKGAGYYASGIVGMTIRFSKVGDDGSVEMTTPQPDIHGCYNAGYILAVSGVRQRGIVGESNGSVHDNALLKGTVDKDYFYYENGETSEAATQEAAEKNGNVALSAEELRSKAAVKKLNSCCDMDGWSTWWVPSNAKTNSGFPVLSDKNPASPKSIAGFNAACSPAAYTGGTGTTAAVPVATLKDDDVELVQGADFRVVPQDDAVAIGSGYTAKIVGIGQYAGSTTATYSIVKGKLSDCTVEVEAAEFDFNGHFPDKGKIKVKTPGGVELGADDYKVVEVVKRKGGEDVEHYTGASGSQPVDAYGFYYVKIEACGTSLETGGSSSLNEGQFRIKPADLQAKEVSYDGVSIAWDGVTTKWISSVKEADKNNPATVFSYTGSPIKPALQGSIIYNGHALVEGKDYRIVYGNPNPAETGGSKDDVKNIGDVRGSAVGCVTVRNISGGNFSSYQNMFFTICNNLAQAKVEGLGSYPHTGAQVRPVPVVKVGNTTLRAGVDYTVSYANNVNVGTAAVTISGKGEWGGVAAATFKIVKRANPLKVKAKKAQTVKFKSLKKKAQSIAVGKLLSVSGARGALAYKKVGGDKKIAMNAKTGKVTLKKGMKKGSYALKVQVRASGDATFEPAAVKATVRIRVK